MKKGILKKVGLPLAVVLVGVLVAVPVLAGENSNPTTISNVLRADVDVMEVDEQILLTWGFEEDVLSEEALEFPMTVGESKVIYVRAENLLSEDIPRVLFIVDGIDKDEFELIAHPDNHPVHGHPIPLGWCDTLGVYYYGDRSGFTMEGGWDETTPIQFTANVAAEYDISVYTVQLP